MSQPSDGRRPGELSYWWEPRGEDRVFDLAAWDEEARAAVCAMLDEDDIDYRWEGGDLVVAAAAREDVANALDVVVEASHPRLDADADQTAYDLGDWPDYEVETLAQALLDEGILHEWTDEGELLVHDADEARVDQLFERLDLRGPDPGVVLEGEALTDLLTGLFTATDRLTRDSEDPDAVLDAHRSILEVEQLAVPYGMDPDGWAAFVDQCRSLRGLLEAEAGGSNEVPFEDESTAAGLADEDELAAGNAGVQSAQEELDDEELDDEELDDEELDDEELDDDDDVVDAVLDVSDADVIEVAARVRDRLRRML